jgi:hypothetical protein
VNRRSPRAVQRSVLRSLVRASSFVPIFATVIVACRPSASRDGADAAPAIDATSSSPHALAGHTVYPRTCGDSGTLGGARTFPDAGPCDDAPPARIAQGTDAPVCRYAITCDPLPPDATDVKGCEGLPNDMWSADALRRCPTRVRYPEGCMVYLPTPNPYWPGAPQGCGCTTRHLPGHESTGWGCPL